MYANRQWLWVAAAVCIGCGAPTNSGTGQEPHEMGAAMDINHARALGGFRYHDLHMLLTPTDDGAVLDAQGSMEDAAAAPEQTRSPGDWEYNVGAQVNGGVALFNNGFVSGTGTGTCADRLYVAVNATGQANLFAFDNLYPSVPGGSGACVTGGSDGGACLSHPARHCPRRVYSRTLSGRFNRNSLTLNAAGTRLYAPSSNGTLFCLDAASGNTLWSFDAAADTGSTTSFEGAAAWAVYGSNTVYIAAQYGNGNGRRIRVYKLTDNATSVTRTAFVDLGSQSAPDGVRSSVLVYDGSIYVASTQARLYRVLDNGSTLTASGSPWPAQLGSDARTSNNSSTCDPTRTDWVVQPILATPTIDNTNDLIMVPVGNTLWQVSLATGTKLCANGGWSTNPSLSNVPTYSSPMASTTTRLLMWGHTRSAGERALFHYPYNADGSVNPSLITYPGALTPTPGQSSSDFSWPRSSPLYAEVGAARYVFIGDSQGIMTRWTIAHTAGSNATLTGQISFDPGYGTAGAIQSPVMLDVSGGYIYYGTDNGRVFQLTQSALN